jgi:hypothetical protein
VGRINRDPSSFRGYNRILEERFMLKATARLVSPAWIVGALGFLSLLSLGVPATAGQGAANVSENSADRRDVQLLGRRRGRVTDVWASGIVSSVVRSGKIGNGSHPIESGGE